MYLDEVSAILKKLQNPKLKKKKRQELLEELEALDPLERIRNYIKEKDNDSPRPDFEEETRPYTE